MPVYEWSCVECRRVFAAQCSIAEYDAKLASGEIGACPECGRTGRRVYDVEIGKVWQEHVNKSLGVVSDPRSMRERLKRQSEEASVRTGIEHNFQLADPSDRKALGVTDEGLKT